LVRLDLSQFTNGMYLIKIKVDKSDYFTKKFMIGKMY